MEDSAAIRLARTVAHPVRLGMLDRVRTEGKLNPARYAEASGTDLANSNYHAIVLKEAGILRTAPGGPRKGPIRRSYTLGGPNSEAAIALTEFFRNL